MQTPYIKTIEDLEKLNYSDVGARFIQKVDAPIISTTTGVYNPIYGAYVWSQLNQEANVFGAIPKVPWGHTGWRAITARSVTLGSGGVAENASIPDTTKPTWATLSSKPKTIAHPFEVSEVQEFLASEAQDDSIASMVDMRLYMGKEHREHINSMLCTNVTTVAGNNFESVDRVVSSYGEVHNCADVNANDSDIYSQDRDTAASWADAYVDHNSNVDRDVTDTLLRSLIQNVLKNGGNPTFFLTGYDTYAKIQGLYETQVRYNILGNAQIQPSVNGIVTPVGSDVGLKVATLYGFPVILSKDVPSDTISRVFLLDTSNPEGFDLPRLSLKIAKPTQYFEAGMNSGDPFGIAKLGNKGMYRTMGELICTFFAAQGKIRDLK